MSEALRAKKSPPWPRFICTLSDTLVQQARFAPHTDHLDWRHGSAQIEQYQSWEVAMGSFKDPRAFEPLDLEIIDRVYEAAWAHVEAREPKRNLDQDGEQQHALRKCIFVCAYPGKVDFDILYQSVIAGLSQIGTRGR